MEEFSEDGRRGGELPLGDDHCPRCDTPVADTADRCPDCGLEF